MAGVEPVSLGELTDEAAREFDGQKTAVNIALNKLSCASVGYSAAVERTIRQPMLVCTDEVSG